MVLSSLRRIFKLSSLEISQLLRSTKIIIFFVFAIFVNAQIISPLRALSETMGMKLSFLEPFVAIGNSWMVILLLPLFFLVAMADFPREGQQQLFCKIRSGKREWLLGQLFYMIGSAVALLLGVFGLSIVLSADFICVSFSYSDAVTKYTSVFPEMSGAYEATLITKNLYNQMELATAALHCFALITLYCIFMGMLLLTFALLKKKLIGIVADVFLIFGGTILVVMNIKKMWLLPMAHTITWLHYSEYERKMLFPIQDSYILLGIANLILIVLTIILSKHYKEI